MPKPLVNTNEFYYRHGHQPAGIALYTFEFDDGSRQSYFGRYYAVEQLALSCARMGGYHSITLLPKGN